MSRKIQFLCLIPQAFFVWWGTAALLGLPLQLRKIYSNALGDKPLPAITNILLQYIDLVENFRKHYDDISAIIAITFLFIGVFIILSSASDKMVATRSFLYQTLTLLFLGFAILFFYVASILPLISIMNCMTPFVPLTMPEKIWNAAPWVIGIFFTTILIFRFRKRRRDLQSK